MTTRSMATVEEAVRKTVESLREVPRKWTEDLETVNDKLANLSNGRHTIRLKVDLEREKASLENSIFKRESGQDLEEYQKVSTMYTKRMKKLKDDKARGEIVDSLINISSSQNHQRYRKRSDLDRAIRMASRTEINELQRHSVIDEFLSDFHSAVPPVYLMHGDMCPNCNEIMKKDTNGGALVCRICGVTSVIQDSTAGAVPFCDDALDAEYANFTHKRGVGCRRGGHEEWVPWGVFVLFWLFFVRIQAIFALLELGAVCVFFAELCVFGEFLFYFLFGCSKNAISVRIAWFARFIWRFAWWCLCRRALLF